ncbi:CAP domain-containing protein [Undibacterium sp. SXout7W]|uniref:CAP domain-containing protein n=1 Tax=Undibacterium sp. SXout7W TaxID=3413049 RepID=UPI003BF02A86
MKFSKIQSKKRKIMFTKFFSKLSVVLSVASLAACGGGGAGSTPDSNSSSPTSPTIIPANLQTTVPAPTYQAGSVELQAFTELNNFRKMVGLGLLSQNSKIDLAAANHANYIAVNIDADVTVFGHYEVATKAGFTGIAPGDRTSFTGYGPVASEVAISNNFNATQQTPIEGFVGTVYHRSGLLNQCPRDVGIGYQNHTTPAGLIANPLIIDLGYSQTIGCQTNASNFVYSYPVADQVNVPVSMNSESPFPFPDMPKNQYQNFDVANLTSYPISIGVYAGYVLTMDSMTVTEQGQTVPLQMRFLTNANDPNKLLSAEQMVFVGYAPFKSATKYNVLFKGAANGITITKSFSFTTK